MERGSPEWHLTRKENEVRPTHNLGPRTADFYFDPATGAWLQPFAWRRWPDTAVAGTAASANRAVVLVHGFVCNRGLWTPWLRELRRRQVPYATVNLEPVFGSIDDYAPLIDDAVARATAATGQPPLLVGHSMGGNFAMVYAGVRPNRIRSVVNLEGFGMLDSPSEKAPKRYGTWLDEIKAPKALRTYASLEEVARRLQKTNHRLSDEKAMYLARHWSAVDNSGYRLLGDAAHKIMNPIGYRLAEAQACWSNIAAPVLHVEAKQTEAGLWLSRAGEPVDFDAFRKRFDCVPNWKSVIVDNAGHMLHHDQPEILADLIESHIANA